MAYVCNWNSNSVTPITLATKTAGTAISIFSGPYLCAVVPDQAPTSLFTASVNHRTVSLDGSSSSSPRGVIANYRLELWRRNLFPSATPTATHTYANNGSYTISLTVTNTSGTSTTQVFTGQTVSNNGGPTAQSSKTLTVGLLAYVPNTGSSSVTPIRPVHADSRICCHRRKRSSGNRHHA